MENPFSHLEKMMPGEDVFKKLPVPHKLGGTAKREHTLTFSCSIEFNL